MMMVMSVVFNMVWNTFRGGAGFVSAFKLERAMTDAVFLEFFTYLCLYLVWVVVGDDVHRDASVYSVNTPQMDVMHVFYAFYRLDVFFNLRDRNAVWCFLQKQIHDVLEVLYGIKDNKRGNSDGH